MQNQFTTLEGNSRSRSRRGTTSGAIKVINAATIITFSKKRSADQFDDLPPQGFDTVIINSVVQYFPSVEYLVRVIEGT